MDDSGLSGINECSNSLIDEPIENFICSDLDINVEPKEGLSDNTIANNKFDCDTDIIENTDGTNGSKINDRELILYQIASDQSILMKDLQLGRHPIPPQTKTETWIQK